MSKTHKIYGKVFLNSKKYTKKRYMNKNKVILSTLLAASLASFANAANSCDYTITKDVKYGEGLIKSGKTSTVSIPLYLDIYTPTNCAVEQKRPIAIGQIHGGGFTTGDKSGGLESKAELAKKGYVVFAINYRLTNGKTTPVLESMTEAQALEMIKTMAPEAVTQEDKLKVYAAIVALEDANKAKNFVESTYKDSLNKRWFLWGSSAGAYTVNNMAYMSDYVFGVDNQPYGIIEFAGGIPQGQYMSKGDANLLIVHGTSDETVAYSNSDELIRQAQVVGVPYQRITAPGEGHGLAGRDVRNWIVTETGKTVFDHMIEFMERSVKCTDNPTKDCLNYPKELTTYSPENLPANYKNLANTSSASNTNSQIVATATVSTSSAQQIVASSTSKVEDVVKIIQACSINNVTSLKQGDGVADLTKQDAIKFLQVKLQEKGIYSGAVTGKFGPLTRSAVAEYQKANNIAATGYFGKLTKAQMMKDYCSAK